MFQGKYQRDVTFYVEVTIIFYFLKQKSRIVS